MNYRLLHTGARALLAGFLALVSLHAATPPAAKLLPPDTLAVLSVPDFAQYRAALTRGAGQFWSDPAMRPFFEKLQAKFQAEVLDKLEREAGIKLADYAELLQGQLTLAVTRNGWQGSSNPLPALVILLDARDKGDQLKTRLSELRKKITDAGATLKTETVRDVEFTTLPLDAEDAKAPRLTFGQVGSVLVAGTATRPLDRVVAGLQGGGLPVLAEESTYAEDHQRFFREAVIYGWIHARPLVEVVTQVATAASGAAGNNPLTPQPGKLIEALGFKGLKTLAFGVRDNAEGYFVDLNINAPRLERKGLLQLPATEPKDASIPGFVPADTVAFWRWRLDGQRFWATLEAMFEEISPGMLGFFTGQLDAALKEKDPNLNFRRSFLMNLGDDLISYQKAPRSTAPADLLAQPSLTLIGSPNPGQLLGALRSAVSLLPGPLATMEIKDREFLGQRIYSLVIPDMTGGGKPTDLHFVASGGYLAISADTAILEEYLRRAESRPKPLAEFPGLREAAEKVGGTGTGLFGFQNDAETMRVVWEALRSNKNLFMDLVTAQNPFLKEAMSEQDDFQKTLAEWLDFSLLPPFERVARYFHFTVFAGQASNAGYLLKFFSPTPPGLR
jgi:hypothetical protein